MKIMIDIHECESASLSNELSMSFVYDLLQFMLAISLFDFEIS